MQEPQAHRLRSREHLARRRPTDLPTNNQLASFRNSRAPIAAITRNSSAFNHRRASPKLAPFQKKIRAPKAPSLPQPPTPAIDTLFPPSLSWIFRDRGAAAMSSRADFRLCFGSPCERGRQSRRNRMWQRKPFRLGSQAKSCSLSPVTQAGGALSGMKNAALPGGSFLPIRFPRPNL